MFLGWRLLLQNGCNRLLQSVAVVAGVVVVVIAVVAFVAVVVVGVVGGGAAAEVIGVCVFDVVAFVGLLMLLHSTPPYTMV